jgi:hypothetical protein
MRIEPALDVAADGEPFLCGGEFDPSISSSRESDRSLALNCFH